MKKLTLFFGALCVSIVAFGQMKVQSDGKIVVNPSGSLYSTQFTLNTTFQKGFYVKTAPNGDIIAESIIGFDSYCIGSPINTPNTNLLLYSAGIKGKGVLSGSSISNGSAAIGVFGLGEGSNSSSGNRNFGVVGCLSDVKSVNLLTPYGAGVFGSVVLGGLYKTFSQRYAGYFAGDVEVNGLSTVKGVSVLTSDFRYKQNIADLRQAVINKLYLLNPVEYNYKQRYNEHTDAEGNRVQVGEFDEESQIFQKKHYGLIAQELREIYPNLVYEDGDGYLSVDYVGIIPLLISSVKELNEKIDALERMLNFNAAPQNAPAKAPQQQETTGETVAALYQNTPNPFNENTEIAFYLPQSVTNAMLCVYDMNGKQLSQNIITQRGSSVFVVNGNQYGAGMYLYSLIADNQLIDTKRMILTK